MAPAAQPAPFSFTANTKLDLRTDPGQTFAEAGPVSRPPAKLALRDGINAEGKTLGPPMVSVARQKEDEEESARTSNQVEVAAGQDTPTEARGFDALMDRYSLHHYIVRHGTTLRTTPEFLSFERKYASSWGAPRRLHTRARSFVGPQRVHAVSCRRH